MDMLTEEEVFYTLLAGLAHDVNHSNKSILTLEGTNNMFEIKNKSKLAQ